MNQPSGHSKSIIQIKVFISGKVQGVGFRAATVRAASSYPLITGYVKNLSDGRVEALFAGPQADVEALVQWCKKGPPRAHVSQIEVSLETLSDNSLKFRSIPSMHEHD